MTELEDRLRELRHPTVVRPAADLDEVRQRATLDRRRRTGRVVALAAAVIVVLVLGAVVTRPRAVEVQTVEPADDAGRRTAQSAAPDLVAPPTFWLDAAGTPSPADLDRSVQILRARVAAAGIAGVDLAVVEGAVAVWMPAGSPEIFRDVVVAVARPGRVSIRPVRETFGFEGPGSSPSGTSAAPTDPSAGELTPTVLRAGPMNGRQQEWYEVGPTVIDNAGITAAHREPTEEGLHDALLVEIAPEPGAAPGAFGSLVASCRARAAACASGRIALVVDADVVGTADADAVSGSALRVLVVRNSGRVADDALAAAFASAAIPVELAPRNG